MIEHLLRPLYIWTNPSFSLLEKKRKSEEWLDSSSNEVIFNLLWIKVKDFLLKEDLEGCQSWAGSKLEEYLQSEDTRLWIFNNISKKV